MIKWCKCVKSYNTEKMFSNVPVGSIRPKQYFECFVGEKFRYKKIRMKNYFIDVPHPFIDYNGDVPNRDEGWPVHDECFNDHFVDITIEMRNQKLDYILK
jgi:hypothetical protein